MEGEIIMTLCELEFYWHLTYFGNNGEACTGGFPWLFTFESSSEDTPFGLFCFANITLWLTNI